MMMTDMKSFTPVKYGVAIQVSLTPENRAGIHDFKCRLARASYYHRHRMDRFMRRLFRERPEYPLNQ